MMTKLYIDNYPELLEWCEKNINIVKYTVYKHNITIHCKDEDEKKLFAELTNEARLPEHKLSYA